MAAFRQPNNTRPSCVSAAILISLFICLASVHIANAKEEDEASTEGWMDYWFIRLALNVLGYLSVIVPAWLVIRYVRSSGYLEKGGEDPSGHGCWYNTVKSCVTGSDEIKASLEEGGSKATVTEKPKMNRSFVLLFCVAGLQGSYLTWGVLQERIMAHEYGKDAHNPGETFTNSQFLVFMNRILAFMAALVFMNFTAQPRHTAPLYKYSYCSLSNIMSSWCQYEALKFVTFPTQVLAKASKIIPVMLMGKVISGKTYEYYEYITAVMISLGVALFLLSQGGDHKGSTVTTLSGVIILVGYMAFDSFTSNWQADLYKTYSMSSIQMMFGVNLFSCLFTSWSLIEQGGFFEGIGFMLKYNTFMFHVGLLSLFSATGQLFIFYTISQFGAVIFTIIMTTRQALAILLSCIIYGHPLNFQGIMGVIVVFIALFLRVYARQRKSGQKPKPPPAQESSLAPTKT
ncbi:adenosine 3'-phospho 5'-phosphosulfate transporter 1-like isoform X1 [Lytechinus pictus]|uniref:adenosine 3'-phospho 5'-phosphosulfate transporter 1-like isoform X1 n=1 Tax=Lytechinus pictus TaxID=7653 RepID=UPI0030BA00D2